MMPNDSSDEQPCERGYCGPALEAGDYWKEKEIAGAKRTLSLLIGLKPAIIAALYPTSVE
jgi:hypothetical protein